MADKEFRLEQIFPLAKIFPIHIREWLCTEEYLQNLEEIRVRVGQPMEFLYSTGSRYLKDGLYRITMQDIAEMMNYISNYSLYAYKEELKQGYITLEGGHRVGMAGGAVMEGGGLVGIQPVTFLNIRVAHEKKGCADELLSNILREDGIYNTLLFSEPGAGKTTLLRDCIRQLSNGAEDRVGMKVCVVDERSEIAACHMGVPQNDLGMRTDVLCGCTKPAGIRMLLRAMSPQILAVDELGSEADFLAVEQAAYSGCRVLGTLHAGDITELREKPYLSGWIKRGTFQRYIGIRRNKDGTRGYQVFGAQMECLC